MHYLLARPKRRKRTGFVGGESIENTEMVVYKKHLSTCTIQMTLENSRKLETNTHTECYLSIS